MNGGPLRAQGTEEPTGSHTWASFVALGDSFTEGLNDPDGDSGFRGWADRLAERLSAGNPELRYANLAVRGKLLNQILAEQLPEALRLRPDLVALSAGGNDILRPGTDPDALAELFDGAVAQLRDTGADVLIATGFDTRHTPVLRQFRGKIATYNTHLWAIAARHQCRMLDLWSMHVLQDPRAWSDDRLHLSAEGHRRVALRAAEALGVPVSESWDQAWSPAPDRHWRQRRAEDLRWAGRYLVPWLGRRITGRSSGDGRCAKRPELTRMPRA